ncbi:MAG: CDP-alcohol phosphatidyltransferase family protein [Bacillota bacterium]
MIWANLLTLFRLLLSPVVFWAIVAGRDRQVLALLILAAASDIADGWTARKTGGVSRLGTVLDPIADKLFLAAVLLGAAAAGRLPAWLVWAYLGKEFLQLVGGAIFLLLGQGKPIPANRYGKTATALTFAGFFALWFGWEAGRWLVLTGLGVGLAAACSYLRLGLTRLRGA